MRALVLLLVAGIALFAKGAQERAVSQTDGAAPSESEIPAPSRDTAAGHRPLLARLTATAGLVAAAVLCGFLYVSAQPAIPDPPPDGLVYVYFDQPNVRATVELDAYPATDRGAGEDFYEVRIALDEAVEVPTRATVILAGSAIPSFDFVSSTRTASSDCPVDIDTEGSALCTTGRGSPMALWSSPERESDLLAVQLEMDLAAEPDQSTWVSIHAPGVSSIASAARTAFQLPALGTSALPPGLLDLPVASVAVFGSLYAPELLLVARYRALAIDEQLVSVSSEPAFQRPLTWIGTAQSSLAISGVILDEREQRVSDQFVFGAGVLAGVVGGWVAPLVISWWQFAVRRRDSRYGARS